MSSQGLLTLDQPLSGAGTAGDLLRSLFSSWNSALGSSWSETSGSVVRPMPSGAPQRLDHAFGRIEPTAELRRLLLTGADSSSTVVERRGAPSARPRRSRIGASPTQQAIELIRSSTHLPKDVIARELLGVSRTSLDHWSLGRSPRHQHERILQEVSSILALALQTQGSPQEVREWLYCRQGFESERPVDLLRSGEHGFARARLLALSRLPEQSGPLPDWLARASPLDSSWSEHTRGAYRPEDLA